MTERILDEILQKLQF